MRAAFRRQPLRQGHEIHGRGLERSDFPLDLAFDRMTDAGHDRILMNIQTGAMRMQNFHHSLLDRRRRGIPSRKSRTRAPGPLPARGTIWGAQGFRVRLTDGLARTKKTSTS